MTKEEQFVNELIGYIFAYPDDDYMTMECLCRKLYKHELIAKVDGHWQPLDKRCEDCIFVEGSHWCDGCDKTPKGMKEYDEYWVKADRKTENCSEFPNNCEHITEDGVTCAKYPACDDCLDNPLNKLKGSERLVKGSEQTEPTISKMEQVVEPQTYITEDRDTQRLDAWQVHHRNTTSVEDEPQTYKINPKEPTNMPKCFDCEDFFTCDGQCDEVEDEPQAERSE